MQSNKTVKRSNKSIPKQPGLGTEQRKLLQSGSCSVHCIAKSNLGLIATCELQRLPSNGMQTYTAFIHTMQRPLQALPSKGMPVATILNARAHAHRMRQLIIRIGVLACVDTLVHWRSFVLHFPLTHVVKQNSSNTNLSICCASSGGTLFMIGLSRPWPEMRHEPR